MSAQRFAIPGVAGAGVLGAFIYYRSSSSPPNPTPSDSKGDRSQTEVRRAQAAEKRDEGLSGAGVGANAVTGGHETGSDQRGNPERKVKTDAPLEKLPQGGVGGGTGAGGANVRAIEPPAKKPSDGSSDNSIIGSNSGSSRGPWFGFGFGGGSKSGSSNNGGAAGSDQTSSSKDSLNARAGAPSSGIMNKQTKPDSHPTQSAQNKGNAGGSPSPVESTSADQSASQALQGVFQQGGSVTGEKGENRKKWYDTKVASNHAATPTKRQSW